MDLIDIRLGPVIDEDQLRRLQELLEILTPHNQVEIEECLHISDIGAIPTNNIHGGQRLQIIQEPIAPPHIKCIIGIRDSLHRIHLYRSKLRAVDIALIVIVREEHFPADRVGVASQELPHAGAADTAVCGAGGVLRLADDDFVGEGGQVVGEAVREHECGGFARDGDYYFELQVGGGGLGD